MHGTPQASRSADVEVGAYVPPAGTTFEYEIPIPAISDSGPLWRAARRAASTVRTGRADIARSSDLLHEDHGGAVDALYSAWRRAYRDGRCEIRGVSLPDRATLDQLRAAFLAELARPESRSSLAEAVKMLTALEVVRERLERDEAQRFRSHFAGPKAMDLVVEVAHDMRSPLTAVLLLTDALRNSPGEEMPPVVQRQAGLVYSAAFGLHALVNDVIELARGGERLFDPEPMSFSVGEIMQSAADIVRPMAEEKRIELVLEGPGMDSRLGQPLALSRVLVNLMTNALKFTSVGRVRVIATERSRTGIEFRVEDTGSGIPADMVDHLFEPFRWLRRGATLENAFSSAGLGLAICRRLVRVMGGELRVETEIGCGTCFSFEVVLPPVSQDLGCD